MNARAAWQAGLVELIRDASSDLPSDVEVALRRACRREANGTAGRWALDTILANIALSRARGAPLCQDTGTLAFYAQVPVGFDAPALRAALRGAVAEATRRGWLRQNTVDPLTDRACADNVGPGAPQLHLAVERRRTVALRLLLKGGGCENVSAQYSLPDAALGAGRDWEGVCRCALDAVWRAQGNGCAPGAIGVCVGGDRAAGAAEAKRQLLRPLDERSPLPLLARLERRILREANALRIGPMGFGGRTTLLGVRIGVLSRLPASYFVSVAYMCWAFRRRGVVFAPDGRKLRVIGG